MGDQENGENAESKGESKVKENLDKMDKNPFFVFAGPYLNFISKGKIFELVYYVMAVINILVPFIVIYKTVASGVFRYVGANYIFAIILSWLVVAFASWIGFQIWWNRRKRLADSATTEFVATNSFSEILQTMGECLGTFIGINGAGIGILATIFLGSDAKELFDYIGLSFLSFGPVVILGGPVIGFFIIILFRFFAEQLRLFASLANNTKEIAANIKNKI